MELLIIKHKNAYIRVKGADYLWVGLDKASVFPFEQLQMVREHVKTLQDQGFEQVAIHKLKLSEEPYL